MFKVCTLSSSSKGNCTFITSGNTNILVDCGVRAEKIEEFFVSENEEPKIDAVVITHEHVDHIFGLKSLLSKQNVKIYVADGVQYLINERLGTEFDIDVINENGFTVGDIFVVPFRTMHDAFRPYGYTFVNDGKRISVATDMGYVTSDVKDNLVMSDVIVLEANHDVRMLKQGNYPYKLKIRISGESGHLSNDDAGRLVSELAEGKLKKVLLAHLSENNNLPELAYSTVEKYIVKNKKLQGKNLEIAVAPSNKRSRFLEV